MPIARCNLLALSDNFLLFVFVKNSSIPPNFETVRIDDVATDNFIFLFNNSLLKVTA